MILTLLIALLSFNPVVSTENTNSVDVTITNLRNNDGHILVSLFDDAESFPDEEEKAVKSLKVAITNGKATFTFDGLSNGTYAIVYMHDENDNGEMDKNLVGIPKEGYGVSNNAISKFSAPKFEEAKFTLNGSEKKQQVLETYYF